DAQSGGTDTALLVSEVFRPPNMPRLLLVLVYRSHEEAPSTMLRVLGERAPVLFDTIHRVRLGPLAPSDGRALGLHMLGRDDETPQRLAERVAEESGGPPLFLRELATAVASSPQLADEHADLSRLLGMRVAELPRAERAVLELVAVANRP